MTTTQTQAAVRPATGTYLIDPTHSGVTFTGRHLMISKVRGRFGVDGGTVTIAEDPNQSSVDATINVQSLESGDVKRDEHLRSADFFNVAEFPRMTFKSTAVHFGAEYPTSVEGNLTLLGSTKPVTLTFERFKCVQNTPPRKDRCGGNAVGKIKRSDFGMKTGIPNIGDEVALNIMFEGDKE